MNENIGRVLTSRLSTINKTAVAIVIILFVMVLGWRWASAATHGAVPSPVVDSVLATRPGQQTAVLAGGCFWGVQAVFQHVKGVTNATSGYSGGSAGTAQYETVSDGNTGHAESVKITFDPSQVTYEQLLRCFFLWQPIRQS
jgi:peptide-methionine (S)-S-oxide reductase